MSQYSTEPFDTSCDTTVPMEINVSGPGFGGGERRVFGQPFVLVGRQPGCSLRLEDAAVSRRHAYLQQIGGRIFCVDLDSRTGIRWGAESRLAGWLHPDRGIQIGPFTLEPPTAAWAVGGSGGEVAEEGDPLQDRVNDTRILPCITVECGNRVVARMRMNRVLVLAGSSPACRVRLREAGVSRCHCSLVRTPEGIWVIDLLSRTGTYLNRQPVRWALVKDDDRLQVGPYVLRFSHHDVSTATPPRSFSDIPAAILAPSAEDTPESVQPILDSGALETSEPILSPLSSPSLETLPEPVVLPVPPGNVLAQTLAVPRAEPSPAEVSTLVPVLQAELDQARERLREAEVFKQQLADSQAECVRLRDQTRVLEIQVAEAASLQAQLEVARTKTGELEAVRAERDQWQAETQTLQARTASAVAEREQWQQRLEAAQQQLAAEQEAVRAAETRLDQESAALQALRIDLAARNDEHSETLQRLQQIQVEFARFQSEALGLQAQLDQARESLRDAEALRQQLMDAQGKHDELCARIPELERRALSADHLEGQLQSAGAETEQLRVQLRDAESRVAEFVPMQAECVRLRDRVRVIEIQVAEAAGLQARLEAAQASARQLENACDERDQWQAQTQSLQTKLASAVAERERWQQRLEAAQQQLAAEQEAVRAAETRLDQESAALQTVRADLTARNTEYNEAVQQLQQIQDELTHSHGRASALQTELDQIRERLRDAEALRQQLADVGAKHDQLCARLPELEDRAAVADRLWGRLQSADAETEQLRVQLRDAESRVAEFVPMQAECVRLRDRVRVIEIQVAEAAGLQAQLEAAQASARQLESVRAERDQWQAEAQELQTRLASKSAEQDRDRVSALERELSEAAAAHERAVTEACARGESERQALEARLEKERQAHSAAIQAAIRSVQIRAEVTMRDVQTRAAAEREEWQKRLEGAEAQIVCERGLFQEQSEQIRRQVAGLQAERDRLSARLAQAELLLRAAQDRTRSEAGNVAEPEQLPQMAVRDQVFAEFGVQMRHLLGQVARTQGPPKPADPPRRPAALEQGVEAAWTEASDRGERLATPPNPSGSAEHASTTCTSPAVQVDAEEAPVSSDTPQDVSVPIDARRTVESLDDSSPERMDPARQGLLRKVLKFMQGK